MTSPPDSTSPALPFLTAALPGCGGRIKQRPEDFVVEELPRYAASGEGTHVYLTIEKRGITTPEAVRRIARALGRQPGDLGYAGLKDTQGITRQRISVEHVDPEQARSLQVANVRILEVRRHSNKLRIGHLAGNRFAIRLRDCAADAVTRGSAILDVLARRGVPNYFGPQRFGRRNRNAEVGRAALAGDFADALAWLLGRPRDDDQEAQRRARALYDAGDYRGCAAAWPADCRDEARLARTVAQRAAPGPAVWRSMDRRLRMLFYSACQSAVFNRVLAERIAGIDRLLDGDVAWKHVNGACFAVPDAAAEQPRCAAFEISPTGPIPGARMTTPAGTAGALERRILADFGGCDWDRRTADGIRLDGARRPLRVPLEDPAIQAGTDDAGPFVQLNFSLPAGAYATSVVRELTRADGASA